MAVVKPIDVMVVIRGTAYPLAERRQGTSGPDGRGEFLRYEAVVGEDSRSHMYANELRASGGYVIATLETIHTRRCHLIERRWDRKKKKKLRGEACDCGAQAALNALLSRGRL